MTKDEDFKLLKIQTCILRVNLHCDGCKHKVKKLLQRIDGVYQVNIDAEQQKVTVSGSLDSTTLIKKLIRAGKHAELWSNKSNETHNQSQCQNHKNQKGSSMKDDKKNKTQEQDFHKALESLKNQQKFQPLISEEDDEYLDDEEDDDVGKHEEEMMSHTPKANHLAFVKQQQQQQHAVAANNNNAKNLNNNNNSNRKFINCGNGEKGNLNLNVGVKMSHNNTGGGAVSMNLGEGKRVNMNLGEGKRVNDMSTIMNNLAGFGNLGGFQMPQKSTVVGSGGAGFYHPNGGLGMATGGYNPSSQTSMMMNINGGDQQHNNATASSMMMMNMHNRQTMHHQQPQMMYNISPVIPPATGYYYNYNPAPYTYNEHPHNYYYTVAANGSGGGGVGGGRNSAAYMFSDENTSSCSVM